MVELQTCAGLVNASALCSIQQEVKGESVSVVIAEMSAELQKEREKNARLMERISLLEAQIQERDKAYYSLLTHNDGQGSCSATQRYMSKCKRQKTEATICERIEDGNIANDEMAARKNFDTCIRPNDGDVKEPLVNWMIMDEIHFLQFDNKVKDFESAADCDDTDESDDEDDDCCQENESNMDLKNKEINGSVKNVNEDGETEGDKRDIVRISEHRSPKEIHNPGNRKSAKVPFCPKEVAGILECEQLLLKNAQSHTIRKILVFASLGIRHGCEDIYELDFNHFHILRKGEPYVSSENPGEHVLYENPGIRKKVFNPNRKNPILCPIQILEEEKAMRPSDPSCPSYLFLCIKYGGRTRNLPQNEYVRQRMGRNKLKSFGPIMCKMALLVNVRSGSFFFKALGITLLFMAGFPDDLVQRETKYRNLDLLQKYYRTDEDAVKEELFLPYSAVQENVTSATGQSTGIKASTKSKARKQLNSTSKPSNLQNSSLQQQSAPSNSLPPIPFGLMGYTPGVSTQVMNNSGSNFSYHNQFQTPYQIFPPQPPNTFMPMLYWPPPPPPQNTFPPSPYPTTYAYQPFPSTGNYISFHPHLYNNQPSSSSFVPKMVEGNGKNNAPRDETVGDSSSSTETKEAPNKGMKQLMNHLSGHA